MPNPHDQDRGFEESIRILADLETRRRGALEDVAQGLILTTSSVIVAIETVRIRAGYLNRATDILRTITCSSRTVVVGGRRKAR